MSYSPEAISKTAGSLSSHKSLARIIFGAHFDFYATPSAKTSYAQAVEFFSPYTFNIFMLEEGAASQAEVLTRASCINNGEAQRGAVITQLLAHGITNPSEKDIEIVLRDNKKRPCWYFAQIDAFDRIRNVYPTQICFEFIPDDQQTEIDLAYKESSRLTYCYLEAINNGASLDRIEKFFRQSVKYMAKAGKQRDDNIVNQIQIIASDARDKGLTPRLLGRFGTAHSRLIPQLKQSFMDSDLGAVEFGFDPQNSSKFRFTELQQRAISGESIERDDVLRVIYSECALGAVKELAAVKPEANVDWYSVCQEIDRQDIPAKEIRAWIRNNHRKAILVAHIISVAKRISPSFEL